MKKIVIIGASGHGKVVADIAKLKGYEEIIFLDDDIQKIRCGKYKVIGQFTDRYLYKDSYDFFVAIGNSEIREKIFNQLEQENYRLVSLIHPSAVIADDVEIQKGTVVMAQAVINSESYIGKGCIINTSSSIDHENYIEDFCHVSVGANLAGNVKIGTHSWIGIGSIIKNNISICSHVTTGAGAVVVKDIKEEGVYIGMPVEILKRAGGGVTPNNFCRYSSLLRYA